jgi:voltage-gated sodium channel
VPMLRLLRLFRVLKLVKSVPQLAVIIRALFQGLKSIGFIGVLLVLTYYVFAIIGVMLFAGNDQWSFPTLHVAMLTLFRLSTLADWTGVMYTNVYGCEEFPFGNKAEDTPCDKPFAWGLVAAVYFILFAVLGAWVMLTLFVGVITSSMDEVGEGAACT